MFTFNISYPIFKDAAVYLPVYYVTRVDGYFACIANVQYIYVTNIFDSLDISDFETNILPAATERITEDDALASATLSDFFITKRIEILPTYIYIGTGRAGTIESEPGWTIKRLTLNGGGLPTNVEITRKDAGIWANRVTETYY